MSLISIAQRETCNHSFGNLLIKVMEQTAWHQKIQCWNEKRVNSNEFYKKYIKKSTKFAFFLKVE